MLYGDFRDNDYFNAYDTLIKLNMLNSEEQAAYEQNRTDILNTRGQIPLSIKEEVEIKEILKKVMKKWYNRIICQMKGKEQQYNVQIT